MAIVLTLYSLWNEMALNATCVLTLQWVKNIALGQHEFNSL